MGEATAERFERFYAAYPRRVARAAAERAFVKINPDEDLLATVLAAVSIQQQSKQWSDEEKIPHPATWLNGKRWTDTPQVTAYSDAELAVVAAYNDAMTADWSPADCEIFSPARAAAIREFLSLRPDKPEFPVTYFAHCAANLAADARFGFDWLIRRDTYIKVREGAVKMKADA